VIPRNLWSRSGIWSAWVYSLFGGLRVAVSHDDVGAVLCDAPLRGMEMDLKPGCNVVTWRQWKPHDRDVIHGMGRTGVDGRLSRP
jgi:hypothetical protein